MLVTNVNCIHDDTKKLVNCQEFESLKGKSLFFTDFEAEPNLKRVFKLDSGNDFFQVKKIKKKLPNTLIIFLSQETPLYRLSFTEQQSYLVSQEGEIKLDDSGISLYTIEAGKDLWDTLILNKKVKASFHQFVKELLAVKMDFDFQKIQYLNKFRTEIIIDEQLKVILEEKKDPREDIRKLNLILDQLDLNSIDLAIKEIDLRFNYPVLRTKSSNY
ncbi:MAG: hypothetical protein PVJ09_01115 [Candidatus Woesebacteria bacterium]